MNLRITKLKLLVSFLGGVAIGFILSLPYACQGCIYNDSLKFSGSILAIGFLVSYLFIYLSWSLLDKRDKKVEMYFYLIGIGIILLLCTGLFFALVYIPKVLFGQ